MSGFNGVFLLFRNCLGDKNNFNIQQISIDRSKMSEEEAFEHAIDMIQTRQMGFRKAADFFSVSIQATIALLWICSGQAVVTYKPKEEWNCLNGLQAFFSPIFAKLKVFSKLKIFSLNSSKRHI